MSRTKRSSLLAIGLILWGLGGAVVLANDAKARVGQVVAAAGGEDKLLQIFRFRERVLITATPAAPVTENEKGNRTSVIELPSNWWLGKNKRAPETAHILTWAWSLRILTDPKSRVENIADTTIAGQSVIGLRVTESIKDPLELFFDSATQRLVCIDYLDSRHTFSEWKQTADGFHYPAHVVGHKFTNRMTKTLSDKQWYQTDILELTPLKELPAELAK